MAFGYSLEGKPLDDPVLWCRGQPHHLVLTGCLVHSRRLEVGLLLHSRSTCGLVWYRHDVRSLIFPSLAFELALMLLL